VKFHGLHRFEEADVVFDHVKNSPGKNSDAKMVSPCLPISENLCSPWLVPLLQFFCLLLILSTGFAFLDNLNDIGGLWGDQQLLPQLIIAKNPH
jgi:hypothetical protein